MLQQMQELQQAQDELLGVVADEANQEEETFFARIEEKLHNLCEKIADEIGADSAAVFFMTENSPPGSSSFMVMRGASGRLKETFSARVRNWRDWRNGNSSERPVMNGFAYSSQVTEEFLSLDTEEREQAIRGWSVTNQIWHLAKGSLANSNQAMDDLHGGSSRMGRGDTLAYPGTNLYTTFRTMIAVPIFAQAGITLPRDGRKREKDGESVYSIETRWRIILIQMEEAGQIEESEKEHPTSASSRAEFLSKYRVIGILKVEGKLPPWDEAPDPGGLYTRLNELLESKEVKDLGFSSDEQQQIREWCKGVSETTKKSSKAIFGSKSDAFPDLLKDTGKDKEEEALILRKEVADVFIKYWHAEFSRQDMELLVLLAMQVGRLMTHRVIKYAADKGIIISENEVGLLNVRWRDINHLVALRSAAEAARKKAEYHLEALKVELDFKKRQEVYRARISELLDPHGPIREVDTRTKEFISLIRKLVRKQRYLEDNPNFYEIGFTRFGCMLEGYDHRSGERFVARGGSKLHLHHLGIGMGLVEAEMKLGVEGAPRVTVDDKNQPVALISHQNVHDPDLPLAYRILKDNIYHIDDLAGARVNVDYNSDIDEVLDELRARVGEWGMELGKVDDLREGKEGGYRAVHVTLYVDVRELIPSDDVQTLREALKGQPLRIPVEVQLRTAYQHSWARKVHQTMYKREEQIAQELRDEQEILSNVLAEADWLSDIVRSGIETMLLPPDYGERRLMECLKRRITPEDMNVVKFGVACAKAILKDRLRYNGQPEFSFVMEICECLVRRFGVTDSTMLLLALLHNVWQPKYDEAVWTPTLVRGKRQSARGKWDEDIISQLCTRLEQTCLSVLKYYRKRLPLPLEQQQNSNWLTTWMKQFPTWFWAIQHSFHNYFLKPPEDIALQWRDRLQKLYHELKWRHEEGHWQESLDEWLERAYMLEAAILLAYLTDLPDEPGGVRRKRLHNDYISLYREIRKYLPNGPAKTRVVEELDRAFREMETRLDLAREPEWWGE